MVNEESTSRKNCKNSLIAAVENSTSLDKLSMNFTALFFGRRFAEFPDSICVIGKERFRGEPTAVLRPTNSRAHSRQYTQSLTCFQDFVGSQDPFTVKKNAVVPPIVARYVRIHPTEWELDICLRAEFYGCPGWSSFRSDCFWVR